jgi:hypothetical protein
MTMPEHTAQIRRDAAYRAARRAEENCPHWDYEDGSGHDHECCRALREAQLELKAAARALRIERGEG